MSPPSIGGKDASERTSLGVIALSTFVATNGLKELIASAVLDASPSISTIVSLIIWKLLIVYSPGILAISKSSLIISSTLLSYRYLF